MSLRPKEHAVLGLASVVVAAACLFALNGAFPRQEASPDPAVAEISSGVPAAPAEGVPVADLSVPFSVPDSDFLDAPSMPFPPQELPSTPVSDASPKLAAVPAKAPRPAAKNFSCAGQICIDADSGETLSALRAQTRCPPASVTKLMTIFVVLDAVDAGEISLSTPVVASRRAQDMGGTQVYLAEGEVNSADDLLYALMLQSANDAAMALAEAVAGSTENFVARMNAKARELGMTRTEFSTPHGLPVSRRDRAHGKQPDMTCAEDLAKLARALISAHPEVFRYTAETSKLFREFRLDAKPLPMGNHNTLLKTFPGCDGLKTGWTNAGASIVATASRGGRRVVAVVLGGIVPGAAKGVPDARASQRERNRRAAELMFDGLRRIDALKYEPTPRTP